MAYPYDRRTSIDKRPNDKDRFPEDPTCLLGIFFSLEIC